MNEPYRYGYGEDPGDRDAAPSGHGSMTDQRDGGAGAARDDDEDEEQRLADQIREADSQTGAVAAAGTAIAPAPPPLPPTHVDGGAGGREQAASTRGDSVFDVEEDAPAGQVRPGAGRQEAAGPDPAAANGIDGEPADPVGEPAGAAGPGGPTLQRRAPIALGPPERPAERPAGQAAPTPAPPVTPAPPASPSAPPATPTGSPASMPGSVEAAGVGPANGAQHGGVAAVPPVAPAEPLARNHGMNDGRNDGRDDNRSVFETADGAAPAAGAPSRDPEVAAPGATAGAGTWTGAAAEERSMLLGDIDAVAIRARFLDIQAGFVDEPRQAVQEAEGFVDELVQGLVKALEGERAKLRSTIDDGSTEDLRVALRGYRAFVERMLNLSM